MVWNSEHFAAAAASPHARCASQPEGQLLAVLLLLLLLLRLVVPAVGALQADLLAVLAHGLVDFHDLRHLIAGVVDESGAQHEIVVLTLTPMKAVTSSMVKRDALGNACSPSRSRCM